MTKDTLHKSEFGLEVVYVIQQRIMFFSKVEICDEYGQKTTYPEQELFWRNESFLENSIFVILSNDLAPLNHTHLDPKIAVQNEMKEKKYK